MKKLLLFACLICLFSVELNAQSVMSDTQVLQFVKREINSGTTRSQVVIKLMQRGVSMDQIRRVRSQYEEEVQKRDVNSGARVRRSDFNEDNVSDTGSDYRMLLKERLAPRQKLKTRPQRFRNVLRTM